MFHSAAIVWSVTKIGNKDWSTSSSIFNSFVPQAKSKVENVLRLWRLERSFPLLAFPKVSRCNWRANCVHICCNSNHSKEKCATRMCKPLSFNMSFLSIPSTSISFVTFRKRDSFKTLVLSLFPAFQEAHRTLLATIQPYYVKMFPLSAGRNISVQIEIPSDIKVLCLLSTTL